MHFGSLLYRLYERLREMIKTIELFTRWLATEKGYSDHTVSGYQRDLAEFELYLREG